MEEIRPGVWIIFSPDPPFLFFEGNMLQKHLDLLQRRGLVDYDGGRK